MNDFFSKFKLLHEKEDTAVVVEQIEKGVVFRGTNLWILMIAIFVASLGLNVNSTAVIIGAMLISPLMGPIMGLGLGMGINDIALLKKALYNFCIATGVALATSTLFFLISPINDAHSEILARTAPNIYDVLIALFGGLAGMLATSSKNKGNVITGVAIATALMPPLCTAGYGIATLQFQYFFGAFYLFIINTVFIALATFFVVRFLQFPLKDLHNERSQKIARNVVTVIVLATLLPSIYFGYDMIQQGKFYQAANLFIEKETLLPNDFLLHKKIDTKARKITLVFGGREITATEIEQLKLKLNNYQLINTVLEIKQGFAYLKDDANVLSENKSSNAAVQKDLLIQQLQIHADSILQSKQLGEQLYKELKVQYGSLNAAVIQPVVAYSDTTVVNRFLVVLKFAKKPTDAEQLQVSKWLQVRLNKSSIQLIVE